MKRYKWILAWIITCIGFINIQAQEIVVTVAPTQQVLPPQVLLYLTDPGKYFNITLTNTTADVQRVYISFQIEQIEPSGSLSLSTPPHRQPATPFTIQPNSYYQLSMADMKRLFDHIPANEVSVPENLFNDYTGGSFGLLPEGTYQIHITAYRWENQPNNHPTVVSNPAAGYATFNICYKAQSPEFITPSTIGSLTPEVAEVDPLNAQFTWTQPVITCGSNFSNYNYDFRVVELLDGQYPDYALDNNPIIYQSKGLLTTMCMIPINTITSKFNTNSKYVAQVTATGARGNPLNYVLIENGGKSPYKIFRIKTNDEPQIELPPLPENEPEQDEDEDDDEEDDEDDDFIMWGKTEVNDSICTDSLYTFRNPKITNPQFLDITARKLFIGQDIKVEWNRVWHLGGEGLSPDTLEFEYEVQLFNGGNVADKEAALETEPIYTKRFTDKVELMDSIAWKDIESKVEPGNYLVLRIKPTCVKGESVAFTNDSINVIDFAMIKSLSKDYFECSNMVEIHNRNPIEATAKDLKGKEIIIGEYLLTIDEIQKGKDKDTWEGKGRVEWNPLGTTVMVCVKFSDLKINTDYVVYDGLAQTYAENPASSVEVVEQLFSDWGIDNLIADSGIPYADYLQSAATDGVKDLAKKIDLSSYYSYVKKGQQVWNLLGSGNIDELYMPIAIPKEVNKSPVDLQITTMKFAPTHATMDLIGEFVLPNTQYTKNDILVLGAPRLCISPDQIIPESGTVALLSDFTILDPQSSYEMTFNAPENVLEPQDGCYIAWHNYKFEIFGIDVDMKIPGLKKDVAGVAIDEQPNLKVICSFSEWEDWLVDNITIDPFQAEDLPGWTFTATDIIYDHSLYRNAQNQGKFPSKYDASKVLVDGQPNSWQGLYIKNISVKMPNSLEFGDTQDRRFEIEAKNMFFDKSGVTLDVAADNLFQAKTGKAGGWSFTLDDFELSFIQNDFTKCGFSGTFAVPLVDSDIEYDCQILKVNNDKNAAAGNYAYIFKTQQIDDINFDFLLATATIDKDLTYMLIEAVPEDKLVTRVELLISGDLDIGGKEYLEKKMKSGLNLTFDIPGVHFSKMRIANCDVWESKFSESRELQTAKDNTKIITSLYKDKQFKVGENFYFNTGDWSLASASKSLGPFEFSLDKYNFDFKNNNLSASIEGTIKLIEGIDLSATAGITINAGITGLQEMDFSKIGFNTPTVEFDRAEFKTSFAGMTINGSLDTAKEGDSRGKGYQGSLLFTMPGDLFKVDATGGYFELEEYTWGYFHIGLGSATGIQIPPIVINDISGGFYFNCVRDANDHTKAIPQKGIIGVIAGLGLSTSAGKDMLNGTFEMTSVYDKENERLSTMMFTGHLEAVSGMIDADASIVYQHDNSDQYFALNITVDAKADGGNIGKKIDEISGELEDLQQQLNSGYKTAISNATGGLADKISDKSSSKADKTTKAKQPEKPKVCETSVSLDFKITMKENGKKLNNAKWHIYLGQPEEDKRCHFTLIDFKSPIVSVNIGANAYLCVGNELPNNGELPPIPDKIRTFLNGSVRGEGVQSDDISQAERARTAALADFNADTRGGVMLGASVWGYVDVDLGLFYGSMGVLAGFDMSLRKMGSMNCMNLVGTKPGYNGWYGEGQLYAYLYANFGIHVNLGFWEKKLPIIDSEIGGVLRMGGPNPTYFTGKARVRARLLAGLVNIDRKFEFECGDRCDLFLGNALDNFKLFGECSLGDTIQSKGWDMKNAINPDLLAYPTFDTEAPIDEHFRVLDETELNRIAANYNGDKEDLKAQASRTFIFKNYKYVILYEYDSPNGKGIGRYYTLKGNGRFRHTINIARNLNPNKYYKLIVQGEAKEIEEGNEVDPLNWNESTHRYEYKKWWQTKTYYFCTGPREGLEDCPDLQEHVAIAYPSDCNQLVYTNYSRPLDVYVKDLRCPNLAFYSDISKDCFKKGTLKWTLYNYSTHKTAYSPVKWNATDSTCNLTPSSNFSVSAGTQYRLKLIYCQSKQNNGKIIADTTTLVDLELYAIEGQWEEGGFTHTYGAAKSKFKQSSVRSNLPYEKPFVGIRIDKIYYPDTPPLNTYSDKRISEYHGASSANYGQWRFFDPYMYISYLSNYAFVGGWELTNDRLKINATTSQSLIYTDKGGAYEGACGSGTPYRITSEYSKIKSLSIFDRNQWAKFCSYPLPVMTGSKYYYVNGSLERASLFTPSTNNEARAQALILDLKNVYLATERITSLIETKAREVQKLGGETFTSAGANRVEKWAESLTGTYLTASYGDVKIEIPYYQFAILWGSQFDNSATQGKVTLHKAFNGFTHNDDRVHEFISEQIWIGNFVGKGPICQKIDGRYMILSQFAYTPNYKAISSIQLTAYRVNSYNFKKAEYTYVKGIDRSTAPLPINISYPLTKF